VAGSPSKPLCNRITTASRSGTGTSLESIAQEAAMKQREADDRHATHITIDKLKEEFLAILPPTIFFFVALHVIAIIRVLMAKGTGFQPTSTMSIAVASLLLG
jgi:hypothetical protein